MAENSYSVSLVEDSFKHIIELKEPKDIWNYLLDKQFFNFHYVTSNPRNLIVGEFFFQALIYSIQSKFNYEQACVTMMLCEQLFQCLQDSSGWDEVARQNAAELIERKFYELNEYETNSEKKYKFTPEKARMCIEFMTKSLLRYFRAYFYVLHLLPVENFATLDLSVDVPMVYNPFESFQDALSSE